MTDRRDGSAREVPRLRSDRLFRANRRLLEEAQRERPDLREGETIDGLIHPREGLLLYLLARRAAAIGDVVEIGSYKGRSTWYLAQGVGAAGGGRRIVSIDPHEAPEQRAAYFETVERHRLADVVDARVAYSHDVVDAVDGPVGMVWIDGDHSYASTRQDVDDWFPRLAVGGWYAMHDTVNAWYGPTRVARELLSTGRLTDVGVVWMTLYGRKTNPSRRTRAEAVRARAAFELLTLAQARRYGFGPQKVAESDPAFRS